MNDCMKKNGSGSGSNANKQLLVANNNNTKATAEAKKPIVLSSQRYTKLMNNAQNSEKLRAQQDAAEEAQYREYLKKGHEELVVHFTENMPRTQDQKLDEMRLAMERKQRKAEDGLREVKENEDAKRRDKIAKAQQLLEKLKPGPRSLHTAAMQSEILRVRNVQRNINAEFERAVKQQECADKLACEQQAIPFIQEEQQRMAERAKRVNSYKHELLQTINETSKQRGEHKQQTLKEQVAAREAMDTEIRAQIEKEKALMEKKRATLRKNALEAMKMVEQRRQRERMVDELEDRLCCVYNTGKRQLDQLKSEHAKQTAAEREQQCDTVAKHTVAVQPNVAAAESARLRRDISRMQLKFTAEEQEKVRKDKAAKQARIEAYLRELQQQKEAKQRACDELRYDMAQRYKNDEVNCVFAEAQKQQRLRKVGETRATLLEQVAEKRQAAVAEKAAMQQCTDTENEKEDRYFFECARQLIEEAQEKQRPLYPLAKVVQQYKRERQIDCERKTPKHLISHLSIGCRQAGDSAADAAHAAAAAAGDVNDGDGGQAAVGGGGGDAAAAAAAAKTDKESILQNCLKIDEIVTAANKSAAAANAGKCKPHCPVACMQHGDGDTKKPYKADGLGDCVSVTSSARLRYSMTDLKKLNQFTAPSLQ